MIEIKKEDLEKLLMEYSSLTNNSFLSDDERRGISKARQEVFKMLEKNNLSVEFEYDKYGHAISCKIDDFNDEEETTFDLKYICPSCHTEFTQGDWNYNYDSGLLDFECDCCGWTGTENQVNKEDDEEDDNIEL